MYKCARFSGQFGKNLQTGRFANTTRGVDNPVYSKFYPNFKLSSLAHLLPLCPQPPDHIRSCLHAPELFLLSELWLLAHISSTIVRISPSLPGERMRRMVSTLAATASELIGKDLDTFQRGKSKYF